MSSSDPRRQKPIMQPQQRLSLVVRKKDLPRFIGKRRTQIDEMIKRAEFAPGTLVSPGGRARIWREDEILAWQEGRFAKRRDAAIQKIGPRKSCTTKRWLKGSI